MENKVKYAGKLELNNMIVPCYVLKNGDRVLSTSEMQRALGVIGNEPTQRSSKRLDEILTSKVVSRLYSSDKDASKFQPFYCYNGKQKLSVFLATDLPEICDLMLKVRDYANENNISLGVRQLAVIKQADIIIRSLAKIGIIALVDEATGYQYEREKEELQVIFKALVSDEILEWQQAFHLSFYKEIFRLWGIPFTDKNIKRKPQFLGHLTNRFIYQNLPKGTFILEKLKEKTPKAKGGGYKYRLHQSLTPEVGREALKKVIYSVEALASISETKRQFIRHINDKYGQREIPFTDLEELDNIKEDSQTVPVTKFDQQLKGLLSVPTPKK